MFKKSLTYIIFAIATWLSLFRFLYKIVVIKLYLLLYLIFHYRGDVVKKNLFISFTDASSSKLKYLEKKFYQYFSRLITEFVFNISISKKKVLQQITLHHHSYQLLKELEAKQQSIFIVLGHYGNWELAVLYASLISKLPVIAIYQPSNNITFDKIINKIRAKFGAKTIATTQLKELYKLLQQKPHLICVVADQTPVMLNDAITTKFLGMDTPFYKGYADLALKFNANIVYASILQQEPYHYEIQLTSIPLSTTQNIVVDFVTLLENDIKQHPQFWLWTHRRWKRAGISY